MKRTTVSMPDDLAAAVGREARRRHISVSEVTREALASHLRTGEHRPHRFAITALGRSGHGTIARDAEKILAEEWASHIANDR